MRSKKLVPATTLAVLFLIAVPEAAFAGPFGAQYFVRPLLVVNKGQTIDGAKFNDVTSNEVWQSVVGYSESSVSLSDGEVKLYAESNVPGASLQSSGVFGERLTIRGGAGTTWDLSFSLEGEASGTMQAAAPGSNPPFFYYSLGIVVFEAGVADGNNFNGIANDPCWGQDTLNCTPAPDPLVHEKFQAPESIPVENFPTDDEFYFDIDKTLNASLLLDENDLTLDLFVYANVLVLADANSGVKDYVLDFSHTGAYSQTFAPGVEVYASSGDFLGLRAPPVGNVPAPGVLSLVVLGLLGLGSSLLRRRA